MKLTRHALPFTALPPVGTISWPDLAVRAILAGLMYGVPAALSGYVFVRLLQ